MIRITCLPLLLVPFLIGCGGGDEGLPDTVPADPVPEALADGSAEDTQAAADLDESVNNLKQIGLALHLFADAHKWQFPAAYTVNSDGEPLLSWRVHILPYFEQQALYEQFHLDEPWDSEHNRNLIEQMPTVYRSPGSSAGKGKTQYLSVSIGQAVIAPPGDNARPNHLPGVSMSRIYDGTDTTIMFLEVGNDQSVVWTKPADFVPDPAQELCGLQAFRKDEFLAVFASADQQAARKGCTKPT